MNQEAPARTETWNPIAVILTFGSFPLVANFVTLVCQTVLTFWLVTPADQAAMAATFRGTTAFVSWLPFTVPFGVAIVYFWPFFRAIRSYKRRPPTAQEKRRLLNAPFFSGLVGMAGWLISIFGFFYGMVTNQVAPPPATAARYVIGILLIGNLCFVLTYYFLEFINRKSFIPRFFPDDDISACDNQLKLSVRARFYIYFSAVSVFPTFLLFSFAFAQSELASSDAALPLTIITALLLCSELSSPT